MKSIKTQFLDYPLLGIITIIGISIIVATVIFIKENSKNIHPIGSNAVYILNEACTININTKRSITEMSADFGECLRIHKLHVNGNLSRTRKL